MEIKNLKLRKIYEEPPEDYEERLSNASKLMACWLVRLHMERRGARLQGKKKSEKSLGIG